MALNKFGQFIRKYRIDNALLLKNMAETLKIGSAYLSGMETGSKPIPSDMVEKISNAYKFDEKQRAELQRSVDESQSEVKVKTFNNPLNQQVAAAFARSIDSLSEEEKRQILEILNGNSK